MEMEMNSSDESSFNFLRKCSEEIPQFIDILSEEQLSRDMFTSIFQKILDNIKILRNNCSKGINYQNYIISLPNSFKIIGYLWRTKEDMFFFLLSSDQINSVKMLLWQLLFNLCVNNANCQSIVLENVYQRLSRFLYSELSQFTNIQLMVLYNISRNSSIYLTPNEIFSTIIQVWSNYLKKQNNEINLEFLHIFFEEFLCSDSEITQLYVTLNAEKRILVLKYINAYIRNGNPNNKIDRNLMEYLSNEFKMKSDCILRTNSSDLNEIHAKEVLALLDVIAVATGDVTYINIYCNDHSLFINVGSLLKCLNAIGQNAQNVFTPMEKLYDIAPNSNINGDYENDISYQLRTQLVRTLANLSHKNQKNQEYAREMEIITAILNCTRIDARNPMMKEWSILAIRNLCENCPENQQLIANLSKISPAPNNTLNELNLEMGSLRIKPDE